MLSPIIHLFLGSSARSRGPEENKPHGPWQQRATVSTRSGGLASLGPEDSRGTSGGQLDSLAVTCCTSLPAFYSYRALGLGSLVPLRPESERQVNDNVYFTLLFGSHTHKKWAQLNPRSTATLIVCLVILKL